MTPDDKKNLLDSLWKMYLENTAHGRHLETQRSTVSNLILILVGAIITLVTVDKHINYADLPAILLIFSVGLFGIIFSSKHYLTYRNHLERARYYRVAIDELLPSLMDTDFTKLKQWIDDKRPEEGESKLGEGILTDIKKEADQSFELHSWSRFLNLMNKTRIYQLWIFLFILVVGISIFLGIVAKWYNWSWE